MTFWNQARRFIMAPSPSPGDLVPFAGRLTKVQPASGAGFLQPLTLPRRQRADRAAVSVLAVQEHRNSGGNTLQIRVETFNVFNVRIYGGPNTDPRSVNFGIVDTASRSTSRAPSSSEQVAILVAPR